MFAALFYMKSKLSSNLEVKRKFRERAMRLLSICINMTQEPEITVSKPIDYRRNIQSFCDSDCKTFFGFNCQGDLFRLLKCFRLDLDRISLQNGSVMSGEEIMLRGLYELVTGEFQSSVSLNVFGRELSQQSRAFSYFIDHMYKTFCHLLLNNLEWFFDEGLLEESRRAIRAKLIDLGYSFEVGEKHTIGMFIDCNCLKTCRPGGGPLTGGPDGLRYDSLIQQAFYNGWKSQHGLKHQTIDLAHGITCHLFGPLSLRHNDLHLLGESGILMKLKELFIGSQQLVTIFGDSAYPQQDFIRSYIPPELSSRHQKEHNRKMKSVRETIEHNYALTKNLYRFLSRIEKLKILNGGPVLKVYTVCTLLRNCHVMLYGSETSQYFNIILDSQNLLEKYTRINIPEPTQQDPAINNTDNNMVLSRALLPRECNRIQMPIPPVGREYIVTNRVSLPGIKLGLAQSNIAGAGYGVFLLEDYSEGTKLAKYSGKLLTAEELAAPGYNTTYVWSDSDNVENLNRRGLQPLIIDSNPLFAPLDWGGMINDGLTLGANVTLMRYRNQVYIQLLEDGVAGMELYLEYGADYWQERYGQLTSTVQDELVQHYGIRVIPMAEC